MTATPLGLYYRNGFIRTISTVWNQKNTKSYIIERAKKRAGNILPIIVLNVNTKKAECYKLNNNLDDFVVYHDDILCLRVESIADYSILKYAVQTSNKTQDEKKKLCDQNELKNYRHQPLEKNQEKELNKFVKELK